VGLVALLPLFSMKGGSFMGKIDWDVVTNFTDAVTTTLKTVTFPKVQEQVYLRNQGNANFTYTIGSQSGTLTPGQSVTVNQDVSSFTLQAVSGTHTFELRAKEKGTEKIETETDVMSQLAEKMSKTDSAKYNSQADYVNIVRNMTSYKQFRVRKNSVNTAVFDVILDDGVKHITYDFTKNANDDFYILRSGYSGDMSMVIGDKKNADTRAGSWNTSTASNYYATASGATFTVTFTGSEVRFCSMTDNRGGLWQFVIDGDNANPVTLSVYSDVTNSSVTQLVKTGLTYGSHTIVGTFMGDDPSHVPSGGAGTSRGWVKMNTDPINKPLDWSIFGYKKEVVDSYSTGKLLLGYASNKEFAFSITKNAITQWFPEHNSIGTAFKVEEPKFLLDNVLLDFSSMPAGTFYSGNSFQLIQHVYCQIPGISGNIAELKITTKIDLNGVVSIAANMKILQDCTISGYGTMLPLQYDQINELYTGIGNYYANPGDDSTLYLPEEQDRVYSFCGVDTRNPNSIIAMTVDYPFKSYRIGKNGRASLDQFCFYWRRPSKPKVYHSVFNTYNATNGETFSWFGRFAVGTINDIYNCIK
jgi:hypothetical protein